MSIHSRGAWRWVTRDSYYSNYRDAKVPRSREVVRTSGKPEDLEIHPQLRRPPTPNSPTNREFPHQPPCPSYQIPLLSVPLVDSPSPIPLPLPHLHHPAAINSTSSAHSRSLPENRRPPPSTHVQSIAVSTNTRIPTLQLSFHFIFTPELKPAAFTALLKPQIEGD